MTTDATTLPAAASSPPPGAEASRRDLLVFALRLSGWAGALASAACAGAQPSMESETMDQPNKHDFDFLIGRWRVLHRRLRERLAGNDEWQEFDGTCAMQTLLGGQGNVDDNVLNLPAGTYHAVGLRSFDPRTRRWAIWWLDARTPLSIESPVVGGFEDGVGTFYADDTFKGRPIRVRFRWSETRTPSPRWEQAFSPDTGKTWETNWMMSFVRVAEGA